MIKDSDLAGFNSDCFDSFIGWEELLRAGVDFDMKNKVSVDVQTILHKREERTLEQHFSLTVVKARKRTFAEADTMVMRFC
jgi:DNA polymerase-3 subunit epsilon